MKYQDVQRDTGLVSSAIAVAWRAIAGVLVALLFCEVPSAIPQGLGQVTVSVPTIDVDRTDSGRFKVQVDVQLTVVPVTVTDSRDQPVLGLKADDFQLFEDGREQKIVHFSREEGPASVVILFDSSGSMKDRLEPSIAAIELLFKTAINGDEFALVRFSDEAVALTKFTNNPEEILYKLRNLQPKGWTSLHDAIHLGVQQMNSAAHSSRVLFILSDGADNSSRYSQSETRALVQESDVRVYALGLSQRPRFLEKLAQETGGEALVVHELEDLPQAIARIGRKVRHQYVLAYSSNNPRYDGRYRKLSVQVQLPVEQDPLTIRSRTGYYARFE